MAIELPYSVSLLNRLAKQLLSDHFRRVKVTGELSNLSRPSSGHLYFSLKDDQAQVRCAMFKSQAMRAGVKLQDGQHVVVTAQVTLYEPRGDYQLVIETIELAGDGALRLQFEQLKAKLLAEGLFDAHRKRPLPLIPGCIGIITSASGAAIHDIVTVLHRRFPAVPVIVYPVAVQGDAAKGQICQALATANRLDQADVLILARGGGALEDLWAFNEETVARAIVASNIPVVSAIGHEVDFTIADFVADHRAPTPSAAAEMVVPDRREWLNGFQALEWRLKRQLERKIGQQRQRLDWLDKSLQRQHPGEKLHRNAQRLDELETRLQKALQRGLDDRRKRLIVANHRLQQAPTKQRIAQYRQALLYLQQRLQRSMQLKLGQAGKQYLAISQTLHAVSPLATLERGYAIAQHPQSGEVIKSCKQLHVGDKLKIRFADGSALSEIKKILTKPEA